MPAPIPVAGGWTVPGNRHDLLDGRDPRQPPAVTVVVPHFRQQPQLDLVLSALAAQTHPATRLQVVVADDGSPLAPVVGPGVVVVRQDDRGFRAAAARNLGAAVADGEVVCFLDADTVPEPGYVEAATRLPALCPDALVVGRRRHADLAGWTPARLRAWWAGGPGPRELTEPGWLRDGLAQRLLDADDRSYRFVISAVLTMPTPLLRELGGFDEGFAAYGGEDWELAYRAWSAGAVLAHEPAAVAWHDGPEQGERGVDATAKNAETLALAARIPDPHLRGGGWWPGRPEVVVEVGAGEPDALLLCARSALRRGDVGVWLPADVPALQGDPRVHVGPVPREVTASARLRVRLEHPLLLPADLTPGVGEGITVTTSRSERRAARHGLPFATFADLPALPAYPRIDPTPDLAAGLDRLARG